jgi:FMN phosphatase YigB (HAD superfamily)
VISTILFDLDGTLLPIEFDEYLGRYLGLLGGRLSRLIAPHQVQALLTSAIGAMLDNNDAQTTLYEAFWQTIANTTGGTFAEIRARIGENELFRDEVPALRGELPVPSSSRELVEKAIESGYEVVLATNPVFPRDVIVERMHWAGLADLSWSLITSYEEMHFAKPHAGYYLEILGRIGRQPTECVMVGNDTRDDLAALAVGVKTFLVEGRVVDRGNAPCPTWKGPIEVLQTLLMNRFSE